MSKRLQVVMPDDEYRALVRAAKRARKPIAQLVRDSLRRTLARADEVPPEERIAAVLRFARFSGPTGDIDEILAEIEAGRGLDGSTSTAMCRCTWSVPSAPTKRAQSNWSRSTCRCRAGPCDRRVRGASRGDLSRQVVRVRSRAARSPPRRIAVAKPSPAPAVAPAGVAGAGAHPTC
jgi:hypothetical protein